MRQNDDYSSFVEGQYVYCHHIPGIHRIIRVYKQDIGKPPMLHLEHLYDNKYNKKTERRIDREYTVDAGNCKLINLDKLLDFESKKFIKIEKILISLKEQK